MDEWDEIDLLGSARYGARYGAAFDHIIHKGDDLGFVAERE